MAEKTAIVPTREQNYPEWYQQVIKAAELAENSPARGCMVIRPWGWGVWENIQKVLDAKIKETGHENAYFPLFIPLSLIEKEAKHVEGFAKECAVVTHHRLEQKEDGKLVPAGELSEPYIVRPTSETIIGEVYSGWVKSYNDLPLLINQWANVVRWEMRPRLFLRTAEFLWQEGHTVHETKEEAIEETKKMLEVYKWFCQEFLAIPVLTGAKSENERFPGAEDTYAIEAMMQDGKALQAGTSHFLGQNFAKSSNIRFQDRNGEMKYAWTTSWGVTTRLIGALVMVHSDDNGLVLPPKIAPQHIVIMPILKKDSPKEKIIEYCQKVAQELRKQTFDGQPIRVKVDLRENINSGERSWGWIKKGVPLRVEIGPRDFEQDSVFVGRRDADSKDKKSYKWTELCELAPEILTDIQNGLFDKATALRDQMSYELTDKEQFYQHFKEGSGFVKSYWAAKPEDEDTIKKDLNVTIRILIDAPTAGKCIVTGKETKVQAIFAKSY